MAEMTEMVIMPNQLKEIEGGRSLAAYKRIYLKNCGKSGFARTYPGVYNCTRLWSVLSRIGSTTFIEKMMDKDGILHNFTGIVRLTIHCGGIRNKNVSSWCSPVFKQDIFPALNRLAPDYGQNFFLDLHYTEHSMIRAKIYK